MANRCWAAGVAACLLAASGPAHASGDAAVPASPTRSAAGLGVRVLPFEFDNKIIFLRAAVAGVPTWVILDTGDRYTVIDLDLARAAGIPLGDPVQVGGGGDHAVTGAMAKGGAVDVAGAAGRGLPVFLALPLGDIARVSGHPVGGVIGYDFFARYVVEIDYGRREIRLHDPTYRYAGPGQTLPITFNGAGHPQLTAELEDRGQALGEGLYTLDIGSGATIILNRPFVESHDLLSGTRPTIPWLDGTAVGGAVQGRIGRVSALRLAGVTLRDPVAMFATSSGGAFSASDAQGNIGAAVLERFKVVLDYGRRQVSLEPTPALHKPFDYDKAGIVWSSSGPGFEAFTVEAVAPDSPAQAAQIRAGDRLVAIDGRPASEFRLGRIRELLQAMRTRRLTFQRSSMRITVRLTPRRRI